MQKFAWNGGKTSGSKIQNQSNPHHVAPRKAKRVIQLRLTGMLNLMLRFSRVRAVFEVLQRIVSVVNEWQQAAGRGTGLHMGHTSTTK